MTDTTAARRTVLVVEDDPGVRNTLYRGSGRQSAPGSGLGLAIVHDLVAADEGTVFAGTSAEGGAEVGFELPPYASQGARPTREGRSWGRSGGS